jgi:hypothetical protein
MCSGIFVGVVALICLQPGSAVCSTAPDASGHVNVSNSLTEIESGAYYGCRELKSITIPSSVTSIQSQAFRDSGLTSLTIPNSVTSIGPSLCYGCENLTSVTIPNSVETLGERAFDSCTLLESLTIPNKVTSVGKRLCAECKSLTSLTISNNVTSIGYVAFHGTGLTSVTIPNSVTEISKHAFWNSQNLVSVTIGTGVKSIGDSAFGSNNKERNKNLKCYKVCEPGPNACHKMVSLGDDVSGSGKSCFGDCTMESLDALSCPGVDGECEECPLKSASVLSSRSMITTVLLLAVLVYLF